MTLTPDRTPGNQGKRSTSAEPGSRAAKVQSAKPELNTLREQLESAGMDMSSNPLAGKFEEMAAVPTGDSGPDRTELPDPSVPDTEVSHPLLTDSQWNHLARLAPELTNSIGSLSVLRDEFRTFERPLGPDDAMTVINGIETASRVLEAMSTVALSIYERCGTPTDYGAKTTKSLVQDRLHLTGREASRRTEMAKNLGNRVDMTGQARGPLNPIVADGLHTGVLSAGQATAINDCLSKLPTWISQDVRTQVETDLVAKAPLVRVFDLRRIFSAILERIDPDGTEPVEPQDRCDYRVTVRQRDNGDWVLSGLLDAVTGGVLNGLLTSRIHSDNDNSVTGNDRFEATSDLNRPASIPEQAGSKPDFLPDAAGPDSEQGTFDIFGAVLAGDISDAPLLAPSPDADTEATSTMAGVGVHDDGTTVDTTDAQGSVRNLIYERFSTVIKRFEMDRVGKGAPYSLVVTANAEDLAMGSGYATTGCEAKFPISTAQLEGLNGSVFFHLMSGQAKTVAVATEKRFANAKQLAIITARDQGCTFPGCDSPPGWCDAHHIVPWADEGVTDVNNLTLACGMHHHLIDHSDWYAVMLKDGRPAWIPPSSVDPARRPVLHARFVAREIIDDLSKGRDTFES